MNWEVRQEGFKKEQITALENRFLVGNGYLGIRGALEEYTAQQLPAVNLAGIFDQVGDAWREPINAPNGIYTYICVDGKTLAAQDTEPKEHEMRLDFYHGICHRKTVWKTDRGEVTVISERFADHENVHRIAMRYTVRANFHAEVELFTGIDGNVWEINGPHFDSLAGREENGYLVMEGITHEKGETVVVEETVKADFPRESKTEETDKRLMHHFSLVTEQDRDYTIEKAIVVFTSQDSGFSKAQAEELLDSFEREGYEAVKRAHEASWEEVWKYGAVEIDGDEEGMKALNYSLYHLQSIAPRHSKSMSIPARGLSGQTYKGAVFWDTEMFMLDYFLFTNPAVAHTLLRYRVDTLLGAVKKARSYGFDGAFYAWESQEGGFDACSDYNVTDVFTGRPMRTFFKDKQIHISAAIVYGIMRYTKITGDDSLLKEGGLKTVIECAKFYYSLLLKRAGKAQYELHDVIGPDEYHERVNNNGYTNRMAKMTLQSAADILNNLDSYGKEAAESIYAFYPVKELAEAFEEAAENLYIPAPKEDNVIEQFDGYRKLEDCSIDTVRSRLLHEKEYWGGAYGVASHTQVIKQADVVAMLNLYSDEYPQEVLKANWDYYEPRTEHGSSLSASMYAMLACKCGMPQKAYPFFIKSAKADLVEGGKEWAGLIYIGGTHPAAAGGAYMIAIEGFGGVSFTEEGIRVKPSLPEGWSGMRFYVCSNGERYYVNIAGDDVKIEKATA